MAEVTSIANAVIRQPNHGDTMKTKSPAGFTLIEIMIVVAIIGLLATMAIPNIRNAIKKSQQQACAVNRKNIDGAKATWALDHRQPPEAIPTDQDRFGDNNYIEHKPDCPAGGDYSLNPVREKCTCSLPLHVN